MYKRNRELWLALIAMILITLFYLGVVKWYGSVPAARSFFGHSLGALGLTMMIMTETLYSLRKRSHRAHLGKMSDWLSFHIFTGLVGPYLALLHTAWKFNGLAGLVLVMTMIVVISGFVGRYIYTSIPRTADGIEIQADELLAMIERFEAKLARPGGRPMLNERESQSHKLLPEPAAAASSGASAGRAYSENVAAAALATTVPLGKAIIPHSGSANPRTLTREQQVYYKELRRQHRKLKRQLANLAMSRRLMAIWHAVHVPLGLAMFSAAFIHVGAAIYFATLLH